MAKTHGLNDSGFTLVELMVVVAIIGILASMALVQFAAYRQHAFNAAAMNDTKNLKTSLEAHYADYMQYP